MWSLKASICRLVFATSFLVAVAGQIVPATLDEIQNAAKDALILLIHGDTQPWFPCETTNIPCASLCTNANMTEALLENKSFPVIDTHIKSFDPCTKKQSKFANRVQRQAMDDLLAGMKTTKPTALIINGDLSDYGHPVEIRDFEQVWKKTFPIPLLLGLGNHDYENNKNDCWMNRCIVNSVLGEINLTIDIQGSDPITGGSLAYSTYVCSRSGKTCANFLQLNNAIDYVVQFRRRNIFNKDVGPLFNLTSSEPWLRKQLEALSNTTEPIYINMHQAEDVPTPRRTKVKQLLGEWMNTTQLVNPRVAVFFAHIHGQHRVILYCIGNVTVPFVYVGSVPNNWFSVIRMNNETTTLYGLASQDGEVKNKVLGKFTTFWRPCDDQGMQQEYPFEL